ncbi:MAG: hypothetical protein Q4B58_06940, partial [Bacteroidales bacterium]|nr:hypothetical protein [Bacteroidales bacterium]
SLFFSKKAQYCLSRTRVIKQPWATLACSGIVRHVLLDERPERIPGLYEVLSTHPDKDEEIPTDTWQEIVNHALFGNINPLHLPYGGKIGFVSIASCREVRKNGTTLYLCSLMDSFELFSSLEGMNYGSPKEIHFPRLKDGILVIPLSRNNFMGLKAGKSLRIELTNSFHELVVDNHGRLKKIDQLVCFYGNNYRAFSVKMKKLFEKHTLTESLCFTLIAEFSK